MSGISVDYTIAIGNIIELGCILIGGIFAMAMIRNDVSALKSGAQEMQTEIKKIGDVLITQADQNRRILHLEDDVRDLRHGRGFVREAIEREFS